MCKTLKGTKTLKALVNSEKIRFLVNFLFIGEPEEVVTFGVTDTRETNSLIHFPVKMQFECLLQKNLLNT